MNQGQTPVASPMPLLIHDDENAAQASAILLKGMGGAARRLLETCVEQSEVQRTALSAAAKALDGAGFILVHDEGLIVDDRFRLTPSLAGEEALEMLERMEKATPKASRS